MSKLLILITGPSASGKTTLERHLCSKPGFSKVVNLTTRARRTGEVNGEDYSFVSPSDIQALRDADQILESAEFGGCEYATSYGSVASIFERGDIAVKVAEPIGRAQLIEQAKHRGWRVLPVFVTNPTEVRCARLVQRFLTNEEAPSSFARRLAEVVDAESKWKPVFPGVLIPEFNESNLQRVVLNVREAAFRMVKPES